MIRPSCRHYQVDGAQMQISPSSGICMKWAVLVVPRDCQSDEALQAATALTSVTTPESALMAPRTPTRPVRKVAT